MRRERSVHEWVRATRREPRETADGKETMRIIRAGTHLNGGGDARGGGLMQAHEGGGAHPTHRGDVSGKRVHLERLHFCRRGPTAGVTPQKGDAPEQKARVRE